MNLLILPPSGGSYTSLRPETEIYVSLAKAGHNITIITDKNREYISRFIEHGIEVIHCPPKHKLSLKTIRLIRKTIKQNNIDLVYATKSRTVPNAAFACIGLNVKLVIYRGTASGLYWHDPTNYLGMLHPRVDGIICVSKYVEDYVASKKVLRNKKIVTIYKGHDLSWYNQQPADLSEFGIQAGDFTAICVINPRPHKGLDVVLEATNQLADIKNLHLVLAGQGIDKEPFTSLINASQMRERIHVVGYRNDAPELIAASDVLIQPSIDGEGLPRVILESLAYGTPVIASANPGSMEIIEDNVNGFIVPIKDSSAIADRLRTLHDSPETLKTLSDNSQHILENEMSHQTTVKHYIEYFESLLGS